MTQCKKDAFPDVIPENSLKTSLKEDLEVIGRIVGQLADAKEFKQVVYSEVAKRFDGDENVLLETLLKNSLAISDVRQKETLQEKVRKLSLPGIRKHAPQIYIPYFQEQQDKRSTRSAARTSGDEQITFVFWDGNESLNDEYPGYILNEKGDLEKVDFLISDQYSLEHEVWVLSFNETVNSKISQPKLPLKEARMSGARESVEIIRIPNLNEIEGWPGGDVELKLSVASSTTKIFEGELPQISRNSVKDQKWYWLERFIFYWYEPDHGKIITLAWVEIDDGGENDQTITYSVPANNGFPAMSYSFKKSNNDENCGFQIVQFDDPTIVQYGTGRIDWKMSSF